jgi:hypothetical protein
MKSFAKRGIPLSRAVQELQPIWQARDAAIAGIAARYISHPWSIDFLLIVSPLVTWLWLGALIMAVGGLIALWPLPVPARRRQRAPRTASVPPAPAPGTATPGAAAPAGAATAAVGEPV